MSSDRPSGPYVSRAGLKLAHALAQFGVRPNGWTCVDLGCSTGGFTDALLQHGAARVYAVDRGYGVLDLRLRNDPRVMAMERSDALQVHLPEFVQLATIDCGWTRQALILAAARKLLLPDGEIITLVKPQYEAEPSALRGGVLPDEACEEMLEQVRGQLAGVGLKLTDQIESPIRGRGGNREFLWRLHPV